MSLSRFLTTVVVAVPLFLVFGFQQPFYILLLMSAVAIGAGYLVEGLIAQRQLVSGARPVPATPTDRKLDPK